MDALDEMRAGADAGIRSLVLAHRVGRDDLPRLADAVGLLDALAVSAG